MATVHADPCQLANFFQNLQSKKYLCDVIFKVGEEKEEVYGIKAILAARSRAFSSLFCSNIKAKNNDKKTKANTAERSKATVIELPEYLYNEICTFMEFVHSGTCRIGPKILIGLYCAAAEYEMPSLKEECLNILEQNLSESNAVYFWNDLDRFKSKGCTSSISKTVSKFISVNAEKILLGGTIVILSHAQLVELFSTDGLNISELNKFHAALIWTKAYMQNRYIGETLHSVFAPFLDYLKLTKIPIQNLVEDVRRSKAVPERLLAHACAHNELKETFRAASSLPDDNFLIPLKKNDATAKQQSSFVIGISASTKSLPDMALMDQGAQSSEKSTKYNKKGKKQSKNKYDLSQGSYYTRPASNFRLTKAKKLSTSTPCLDLMF